ncbi:hypothetical protein V0U79_08560 [Hyphobacterium sp. HN65]|uniref:Uncharacterized protein n=1 Tax=Hyphobacterium lacteum TaxID=3116575 RepID=A0ABU7LR81_9PROT|nr:hypothetical protein [Hyphobacterium sp. HN65]MEE2526416.1 hypothetical protein [Hyphobacterium sp. HN65]
MKTMLMISAAIWLAASAAPAFAQSDSIQSRPTTQPRSPGGEMPSDTNEPDKPGGEDGDGEPTPGGGGGEPPRDGDFDPDQVNFPARQTQRGGDGMDVPGPGPQIPGPIEPEIPDEPEPEPEPEPQPAPTRTSELYCCVLSDGSTQWTRRNSCIRLRGRLAEETVCADPNAGSGETGLPAFEGFEVHELQGNEDTRSGETVDGEPVRRRERGEREGYNEDGVRVRDMRDRDDDH